MISGQLKTLLFCALLIVSGCTKSGGGSDEGASDERNDGGSAAEGQISTDCGIVSQGLLHNPIDQSAGKLVTVNASGSNLAIVGLPEGEILVKLQGLDPAPNWLAAHALDKMKELASGGRAWYFRAEATCTVRTDGGGIGEVGQLVTPDGRSFTEEMIRAGFGNVDTRDVCSGHLVGGCYGALAESSKHYGGVVQSFLWKPVSEADGNLAILMRPGGTEMIVNGVSLGVQGDGVWRTSQPGCAYGGNVKIQVRSRDGGVFLWPDGSEEYTVASGCARTEMNW